MRRPDRAGQRDWVLDPVLFGLVLISLGFITVALAITGRLLGDVTLMLVAGASVVPAFFLFYRRSRALHLRQQTERHGRR
ncbi:MAG: hypothetical protein U0821_05480 [Chloroflexota bacterium]